jgi:hypothetical protein
MPNTIKAMMMEADNTNTAVLANSLLVGHVTL